MKTKLSQVDILDFQYYILLYIFVRKKKRAVANLEFGKRPVSRPEPRCSEQKDTVGVLWPVGLLTRCVNAVLGTESVRQALSRLLTVHAGACPKRICR